jgi:hypothetical protein
MADLPGLKEAVKSLGIIATFRRAFKDNIKSLESEAERGAGGAGAARRGGEEGRRGRKERKEPDGARRTKGG